MPGLVGPWEILILAVIVALFAGPKQLPRLARAWGKAIRELRQVGKDADPRAALEEYRDGD